MIVRRVIDTAVLLAVLATIAHTWLVSGLLVPVVVSSGSMAPALLGPHRQVVCHACGFSFDCDDAAKDSLPSNLLATCPNCGLGANDLSKVPSLSGDRLIVNRAAFALRPPRRWEVAVFHCPDNPQVLCVKRIVGLPGETVRIRDGDVFVNDQRVQKSLDELRDLALIVNDDRNRLHDKQTDRWRPELSSSRWRRTPAGFYREGASNNAPESPSPDWLVYEHRQASYGGYSPSHIGPIVDDSSYNQNESRLLVPVADLLLQCQIQAPASGMSFRIKSGGKEFVLDVNREYRGRGKLCENGSVVVEFTNEPGLFDYLVPVELALADHRIRFSVGRRILLDYPVSTLKDSDLTGPTPLAISSDRNEADVRKLTVLRDVYYTAGLGQLPRLSSPPSYKLGPDEYFVLGDNSPLSEDSRTWKTPGVPAGFLVGKVLMKW